MPQISYLAIKFLVYFIAFYAVVTNPRKFFYYFFSTPLLVVLTVLAFLSVFWSTIPNVTLDSARNLLILHFSAVYIAMKYDLNTQIKYLSYTFGVSTLLSILLPQLIPSYGFTVGSSGQRNWVGIFRHKNRLANAMAMALLTYLSLFFLEKRGRWILCFISILSIANLLLSQGRSALASFLLIFFLYSVYWLAFQKNYKRKIFSIVAVLYLTIATALGIYFGLEYFVVELLGKDLTLTGRTDMWSYLIERGMSRPLLGFGYGGFWKDPVEALGVFKNQPWFDGALDGRGNAHSGYVQLFLQLGFLGSLLVAACLCITIFRVVKIFFKKKSLEYFWAIQYLALLILLNFSETNEAWMGSISIGWLLFISISIGVSPSARNLGSDHLLMRGKGHYLFNKNNNPYLIRN